MVINCRLSLSFLLVLVLFSACKHVETVEPVSVTVLQPSRLVTLSGRPFLVELVLVKAHDEKTGGRVLTIQGDGRLISFAVASPSAAIQLTENTLKIGTHTFAVTKKPGHYLCDGKPVKLEAAERTLHVFENCVYSGTESL